jgi:hypothetical protein
VALQYVRIKIPAMKKILILSATALLLGSAIFAGAQTLTEKKALNQTEVKGQTVKHNTLPPRNTMQVRAENARSVKLRSVRPDMSQVRQERAMIRKSPVMYDKK